MVVLFQLVKLIYPGLPYNQYDSPLHHNKPQKKFHVLKEKKCLTAEPFRPASPGSPGGPDLP